MDLVSDVRRMHRTHPSSWLVAWSRVMTMRSVRVQRYLNASAGRASGGVPVAVPGACPQAWRLTKQRCSLMVGD